MTDIMTIGYGGKKPHAFFDELAKLNADLVIDVRWNPFKAFLGVYTCKALMKRVPNYVWIIELGNPSRKLPPTLMDEKTGLDKAMALIKNHKAKRVVLLCAEKDENRCHRKYVKEKLIERLKKKIPAPVLYRQKSYPFFFGVNK